MVKLEKVNFSYGEKKVLENFSLEIRKGDRICLSGASGCGKTTVLKLIAGLVKPKSGSVSVLAPVSVVFQEDRLLPWYTVRQNVELVMQNKDTKKVEEILDALSILSVADEFPSSLSGGMKRRVAIARALAFGGEILLLDEVFNGIDKETKEKIANYILDLYADKTVIAVSHIKEDAVLLNAKIFEM